MQNVHQGSQAGKGVLRQGHRGPGTYFQHKKLHKLQPRMASAVDDAHVGQEAAEQGIAAMQAAFQGALRALTDKVSQLESKLASQQPSAQLIGGERAPLEAQEGSSLILRYWDGLRHEDYQTAGKFKWADFKPKWEKDNCPREFEKYVRAYFRFLRSHEGDLDTIPLGMCGPVFIANMRDGSKVKNQADTAWEQIQADNVGTREALTQLFNVILADRQDSFRATRERAKANLEDLVTHEGEGPRKLIQRMMDLALVTHSSPAKGSRVYITDRMVLEKFPKPFRDRIARREHNPDASKRPPVKMLCTEEDTQMPSPKCPATCGRRGILSCGVAWYVQLFEEALESGDVKTIWPGSSNGKASGKKGDRPAAKGHVRTKMAFNNIRVTEEDGKKALKELHDKYGHSGTHKDGPLTKEIDAKEIQVLTQVGHACRGCLRPLRGGPDVNQCRGSRVCDVEADGWKSFRAKVEDWFKADKGRQAELNKAIQAYLGKMSKQA